MAGKLVTGRKWVATTPLSNDEVHAIRMLRGLEPARVTGKRFDRSQPTIHHIQVGAIYNHVPWTDEERNHLKKYRHAIGNNWLPRE